MQLQATEWTPADAARTRARLAATEQPKFGAPPAANRPTKPARLRKVVLKGMTPQERAQRQADALVASGAQRQADGTWTLRMERNLRHAEGRSLTAQVRPSCGCGCGTVASSADTLITVGPR